MCGRYQITEEMWARVRRDFPEAGEELPVEHAGDRMPGAPAGALVAGRVRGQDAGPVYEQLRWGFRGYDGKSLVINARAESLREKRMFAESARTRRCVLPASGFYEWDAAREKVCFTVADRDVIYLGGLWRPAEDGNEFVVITKEANESMRPVHDRMPMLLTPEEVRRWLAPGEDGLALLGAESPVLAAHREYEQMRLF